MLRGQYQVGRPKQGVRPGRVDRNLFLGALDRKNDLRALALADPVSLHLLEGLGPLQKIQILQEALRIRCDLQHPLAHGPSLHRMTAAFGTGSLRRRQNFLVGQNRPEGGAVPHRSLRHVGQAFGIQLKKDPLGPAEVLRVGGINLALPVVTEAHRLDLPPEVVNISRRRHPRVRPGLHRMLLRR